jgi:hypothetical protein
MVFFRAYPFVKRGRGCVLGTCLDLRNAFDEADVVLLSRRWIRIMDQPVLAKWLGLRDTLNRLLSLHLFVLISGQARSGKSSSKQRQAGVASPKASSTT